MKKINWKKVRDYLTNGLAALVFLYAFAGTSYGLYEAHENNTLQHKVIRINNTHHSEQVTANKKAAKTAAQLKVIDAELGVFAGYLVQSNVADCAGIESIADTWHIVVPRCPAIPKLNPIK